MVVGIAGRVVRVADDGERELGGVAVEDFVVGDDDGVASDRTVTVACPDARKIDVLDAVRADDVTVTDFETSEPSLEEMFASLTEGDQ